MTHYRYLIVGGGMTAAAAVSGIRQADPEGSIGLVSQESHPPYNRPPLSKGLWKGKPIEKIFRKTDQPGVELHLDRTVTSLDPAAKMVVDDLGESYTYDKLLLATGGTPRQLPFGDGELIYFRTLDDYYRLRGQINGRRRIAVIGGGFIGSEIAAALAGAGQDVVMVFPNSGIGGAMFPTDLSQFLNDYYREKGVDVRPGEKVAWIERRGEQLMLQNQDDDEIAAEAIVAGIGILPNTELAQSAGLPVDNGIIVDEYLRTSQPDIYAAGDAANFFNPLLDKRLRVEHEDNANTMGKLAGLNMASSRPEPYRHLPFFYSDLFDLGYEAVGELSSHLETFADWQEKYRKGVIYYLDHGSVRGVLLWNVWDQVDAARKLMAEPGPFSPENLKGRLPA
jgi:3-phenylpropionate/trans-cinnamate dioxygenase ferredoxin reductase subunit